MVKPLAPSSMDEFEQQASAFVAKAKAAGKSNTAISNTLKFMYQMTQDAEAKRQAEEMTPYQQASIDLENKKFDAENAPIDLKSEFGNGNASTTDVAPGQIMSSPKSKMSAEDAANAFSDDGVPDVPTKPNFSGISLKPSVVNTDPNKLSIGGSSYSGYNEMLPMFLGNAPKVETAYDKSMQTANKLTLGNTGYQPEVPMFLRK